MKTISICDCLLSVAVFLALQQRWRTVGVLLLAAGYGGIGAAWGLWTQEGGDWLNLAGAKWPPPDIVSRTAGVHALAMVAGLFLLRKDWD